MIELWNTEPILFMALLGILAGLIVLGWFMWSRIANSLKHKVSKKPLIKENEVTAKEPAEPSVRAEIWDSGMRTFTIETVPPEVVAKLKVAFGNLGTRRNFCGEWIYAFSRMKVNGEDVYAIAHWASELTNSAKRLGFALNPSWVKDAFPMPVPSNLLNKLLPVMILAGAFLFAMFLLIANKQGN